MCERLAHNSHWQQYTSQHRFTTVDLGQLFHIAFSVTTFYRIYAKTLSAEHPEAVSVLLLLVVLLGLGLIGLCAKDEFGGELPVVGQVVLLLELVLGQVSVVLQVGTVAGVGEGDPGVGLCDGGSVLRPDGEVIGVLRDVLLLTFDDRFDSKKSTVPKAV